MSKTLLVRKKGVRGRGRQDAAGFARRSGWWVRGKQIRRIADTDRQLSLNLIGGKRGTDTGRGTRQKREKQWPSRLQEKVGAVASPPRNVQTRSAEKRRGRRKVLDRTI